jgi:hypothetical protein
MTEMPLAKTGGGVALLLEMIGDGVLIRIQPGGRGWKEHMLMQTDALRIAAGEQCRTRRRANRGGDHEAGEFAPLPGQPVDVGRADGGRAETAEVAIALIVGKDDDEVGLAFRSESCGSQHERGCDSHKHSFHRIPVLLPVLNPFTGNHAAVRSSPCPWPRRHPYRSRDCRRSGCWRRRRGREVLCKPWRHCL